MKQKQMISYMMVLAATGIISVGCSGTQKSIYLEPGNQAERADVDLKEGSITQTIDDVEVSVKGVILPESSGKSLHPSFWVTIKNNRNSKIQFNPSKARLVDSFGDQFRPLPMSLYENGKDEFYYKVINPDTRLFYSIRYGWDYYPFYPYKTRFHRRGRGRHVRIRYVHYDPFWRFGGEVFWIRKVNNTANKVRLPDREEEVYDGAKLTYALTFPEINEEVDNYRLIIPDILITDEDNKTRSLKFELIFNQIVTVESN